jgi:uncharacterized phage protein gp47/JayE
MSQVIPTTQSLADDAVAQVDASTEQTTPLLAKAFLRVLAKVNAGADVLLYKYAGWMLLQQFVAHASMRETTILGRTFRPLVEWGKLFGAGEPLAASRAELAITVFVTSQVGNLASGRQLVNPTTGVVYTVTASVALDAATVTANVRAASDQQGGQGEGVVGNMLPGAELQFANPLPNIQRTAVVSAQTVTGAEAESVTAYRARVIRKVQAKPQGGAYADYRAWAEDAAGIVNVYPYTGAPGTVDVYVEATPESSGSVDGIPTLAQRNAVKAAIETTVAGLASRRPANAFVRVLPISRTSFDVVVTGMAVEDVAAAEDAVEAAVDEYLRTREPFIVGLSVLPRLDRITHASISGIIDDVVSALGGSVAIVALKHGGESISAYTLQFGQKAKLGAVTYIS